MLKELLAGFRLHAMFVGGGMDSEEASTLVFPTHGKHLVTHSVSRDGELIHHPGGMDAPVAQDMGAIMKDAVKTHINARTS